MCACPGGRMVGAHMSNHCHLFVQQPFIYSNWRQPWLLPFNQDLAGMSNVCKCRRFGTHLQKLFERPARNSFQFLILKLLRWLPGTHSVHRSQIRNARHTLSPQFIMLFLFASVSQSLNSPADFTNKKCCTEKKPYSKHTAKCVSL